jgi:hypothetical protein
MSSDQEHTSPSTPRQVARVSLPSFGSSVPQRIKTDKDNHSGYPIRQDIPRQTSQFRPSECSSKTSNSSSEAQYQEAPVLTRRQSNTITGLRTELMNIKT